MKRLSRVALVAGVGLAATLAVAIAADAPAASTATSRVTYLSGPSIYVEAGRDDGLEVGDRLEVVREGAVVARLQVAFISGHRAACTAEPGGAEVVVGDTVRYTPRARPAPSEGGGAAAGVAAAGAAPAGGSARGSGTGLHGRIGVRYLSVNDKSNPNAGFSQHGLDLWIMDQGLGPIDLYADIRARRTYRTRAAGEEETENLGNVYRLAAAWHPGDERQTLSVGRQFAAGLPVVNLFDGVLYDFNAGKWSLGGFAGTEPEAFAQDPEGTPRDLGGYWQYRGGAGGPRRFLVTTGVVTSSQEGETNRQFFFLQGQYQGTHMTGYLVQEVDYYSGWKVDDAGESTISPTSTFANFNYRASDKVAFYGGYDNRRSVRLYRDRITPVTEFDDAHRQGGWGGASFRMGDHLRMAADLRRSTGGTSGTADGYSLTFGADGMTRAAFSIDGRGTHYANEASDGWLYSVGFGLDPAARLHVEVGYGRLEEQSDIDPDLDRSADWIDVEAGVLIGRHWYLLLSEELYRGDGEDNDQTYATVSWRF